MQSCKTSTGRAVTSEPQILDTGQNKKKKSTAWPNREHPDIKSSARELKNNSPKEIFPSILKKQTHNIYKKIFN